MCIAFFVNNCIAFVCPLIFMNTKSFMVGWKRVSSVSKIFTAPLTSLPNSKRSTNKVSSVKIVNNTGRSYGNTSSAAPEQSSSRAGDLSSISSSSWYNIGSSSTSLPWHDCLRRFLSDRSLLFRSCCVCFWHVDVALVFLVDLRLLHLEHDN